MKIENGETILYINQYYEKNLTTGNVTSSYYLGGRLVATKENEVLRYVHQDHLTGTSLMTDASGAQIGQTMKYLPFGQTPSGAVPTDKKFTGQRLDATGLYYYNARYYDATIGRFISADTVVQSPAKPQSLNRYSYTLNNPLKYTDPSGHELFDWYTYAMSQAAQGNTTEAMIAAGIAAGVSQVSSGNPGATIQVVQLVSSSTGGTGIQYTNIFDVVTNDVVSQLMNGSSLSEIMRNTSNSVFEIGRPSMTHNGIRSNIIFDLTIGGVSCFLQPKVVSASSLWDNIVDFINRGTNVTIGLIEIIGGAIMMGIGVGTAGVILETSVGFGWPAAILVAATWCGNGYNLSVNGWNRMFPPILPSIPGLSAPSRLP